MATVGLIFKKDHGPTSGCEGCGEYAESCTCPPYLHPYTIAMLERAASACSTERVRIDLLAARRLLIEHDAAMCNVLPPDQLR